MKHYLHIEGAPEAVTEFILRCDNATDHNRDPRRFAFHEFLPMPAVFRFASASFGSVGYVAGFPVPMNTSDPRVTYTGHYLLSDAFGVILPDDAKALTGFETPDEWMHANWASTEPLLVEFFFDPTDAGVVTIAFITVGERVPWGVYESIRKMFPHLSFEAVILDEDHEKAWVMQSDGYVLQGTLSATVDDVESGLSGLGDAVADFDSLSGTEFGDGQPSGRVLA